MRKYDVCEKAMALCEQVLSTSAAPASVSGEADTNPASPGVAPLLSVKNRMRYQRHIEICEQCRVSHRARLLMRMNLPEAENELKDRRLLNAAIAEARLAGAAFDTCDETAPSAVAVFIGSRRRAWLLGIGVAAALLIAVAGFAMGWWMHVDKPQTSGVSDAVARNQHQITGNGFADELWTSLKRIAAGGVPVRIIEGDGITHLAMAPGVDVLLDARCRMKIREAGDTLLRVQLLSGRMLASVDPDVPHPRVVVETPKGTVMVKGTIFSVDVAAGVRVSVLRGVVQVVNPERTVAVPSGKAIAIGNTSPSQMSETERSALTHSLFDLEARKLNAELLSVGAFDNAASNNAASIVENAKGNPSGGWPRSHLAMRSGDSEGEEADAVEMLPAKMHQARVFKNAHNWSGALAAYESVIASAPQSSFAASARIAAGNIRLRSGDAVGALGHYDNYLSSSHSVLRQEALLGRIKSLRKLHRTDQELSAVNAFIAAYPNSIHVNSLLQRRRALE